MSRAKPRARGRAIGLSLLLAGVILWALLKPARLPGETHPVPGRLPGQAPVGADDLLSPQQMLHDLRYISSTVQQVHPALGDPSARARFASRAASVEAQLSQPLPGWRFFALANGLVASLQDAHTSLRPPEAGLLPLGLTWAEDGIVVSRVLDPLLPLQPGDELVSMGGRTPEEILVDLASWIPHANPYRVRALADRYLGNPLVLRGLGLASPPDGEEQSVEIVARRRTPGRGSPEAAIRCSVPVWTSLTVTATVEITDAATGRTLSPAAEAGLRPGDRILKAQGAVVRTQADLARAIQVAGGEGRTVSLQVSRRGEQVELNARPVLWRNPGTGDTSYAIGLTMGAPPPPPADRPWFGWTIDRPGRYGLFWLDDCNNTSAYRRAVDEFFSAVRHEGMDRIAIDLRRNGGGDSRVVSAFLKYLPYRVLYGPTRGTRPSPPLARQRSLGVRLLTRVSETFFNGRWYPYPLQPRARKDQLFQGQVYVLVSWQTFSSAVDFATLLSDNQLASIVGTPTGGTPSGYGDVLSFTAPTTGWHFNVSSARFSRPDPRLDPADTLCPHVFVPTTVDAVRKGEDPVLGWLGGGG